MSSTYDLPVASTVLNSPFTNRTVIAYWYEVLSPNRMAQMRLAEIPTRSTGLLPILSESHLRGGRVWGWGDQGIGLWGCCDGLDLAL